MLTSSKNNNSQVFLLKNVSFAEKCEISEKESTNILAQFANAKATHIFSAKILAYMPHLMIKFLTIH